VLSGVHLNEMEITGIDLCYFNNDVPKTAFITPMELFEFKVLPFGLANSPSAFTEVMNTVFRNFIGKFVVIYLDDIIIFSKDDEEHEKYIRMVLQRLEDNHLFLSREKCRFFQPEVKYLGHVLSGDGIRVNATKVKAVNDWPTPKTSKEVQQFLGLSNFFRKFIQGYSSVAAPLIAIANRHDTRPGKCKPAGKPLGKRQQGLQGLGFKSGPQNANRLSMRSNEALPTRPYWLTPILRRTIVQLPMLLS